MPDSEWRFDRHSYEWQCVRDDEILVRVAVENWDTFLDLYGGGYVQSRGFNIPVPPRRVFLEKEEAVRNAALIKVLRALT